MQIIVSGCNGVSGYRKQNGYSLYILENFIFLNNNDLLIYFFIGCATRHMGF